MTRRIPGLSSCVDSELPSALKYHPDRNPGRELEFNPKFQAIQAAYEVLVDSVKRSKYDTERQNSCNGFVTSCPKLAGPNPYTNPYIRPYQGWTTFHEAAIKGDVVRLRALLKGYRAYVDTSTDEGWITPLHFAAYRGHEAVVQLLLDIGADIAAKNDDGGTVLHCAAAGGHEAVVRLLLDIRADIAAKNNDGGTALYCAAASGHEAVVRLLVGEGADIAAKNNDGGTALHYATASGHEAVVRLLLDKGADIKAQNNNSGTALHMAVWGLHSAVIRLLLIKEANVKAKTVDGETARIWRWWGCCLCRGVS